MRRTLTSLALLLAATAARADEPPVSALPDEVPKTESFTLENGLRVLLQRTPMKTALVQVLYTIGENDDPPGRSGLAAVMQALYESCPAGDVVPRSQFLVKTRDDATGRSYVSDGTFHTHLGDDYTSFCRETPPDRLRSTLREEAARMADLRIEAFDLTEAVGLRSVRFGPRFSLQGLPGQRAPREARERIDPLAGGGVRGGILEQIQKLDLQTVRERMRLYNPKNAILTVVGNFDPDLLRAGVRRQFGHIGGTDEPARRPAPRARADLTDSRIATDPDARFMMFQRSPGPPAPAVALAVEAPVPTSHRAVAAALLLARRFESATRAAASKRSEPATWRDLTDHLGEGARYVPFVDARAMTFTIVGPKDVDVETLPGEVRRRVRALASAPVQTWEIEAVRSWDVQYPTDPTLDPNLVRVLAVARRALLGMDPEVLSAELGRVTPDDMVAVASAPSVAVVAVPSDH